VCATECNWADESRILDGEGRYFPLKMEERRETTTSSAGKNVEFLYLNWTYSYFFIQQAILESDCQKETRNELLIMLFLRMGWQGR